MAPLAWGASSRAMVMDPGSGRHWVARAMLVRVMIWLRNSISPVPCNKKASGSDMKRDLVVRRLNPRDVPWYCGPAGGQVDVKIGLGKVGSAAAAVQAQSGKKKEEGPVVWPDAPDPSTPGPDSRFGAGRGQEAASAFLPLILPKDFDLGIYLAGDQNVTAAVVTCDRGWGPVAPLTVSAQPETSTGDRTISRPYMNLVLCTR